MHTPRRRGVRLAAALVLAAALAAPSPAAAAPDPRAWSHGIDLVAFDGRLLVVFSSNGYPPIEPGDNWGHDIRYAWLDPASSATPEVATLVHDREAQEPASAAVNAAGRLLVTSEDGSAGINQRAGLWGPGLARVRPWPVTIMKGGHSGHAAASGTTFLVAVSEGWIDGGGVDNLGTGDDVWARIVKPDGALGPLVKVAATGRDGWPVAAGSEQGFLVVWQRFDAAARTSHLMARTVSRTGVLGRPIHLPGNAFYRYDVQDVPALGRYLVAGTGSTGGFAALLDRSGALTSLATGMPAVVREAQTAVLGERAAYPTADGGVAELQLTAGTIALAAHQPGATPWPQTGTDGAYVGPRRVVFVTTARTGLEQRSFDLPG